MPVNCNLATEIITNADASGYSMNGLAILPIPTPMELHMDLGVLVGITRSQVQRPHSFHCAEGQWPGSRFQ